jgi:hypothetical protein
MKVKIKDNSAVIICGVYAVAVIALIVVSIIK